MKSLILIAALFAIAALAAPKARQTARPSPRIDVILHSSNSADADKMIKDIDREMNKAAKKDANRNRDLTLVTNSSGSFSLSGTTFLTDTNEADAFISTIIAFAKPAQMSGVIIIHHCPEDDDVDYRDWAGCKDDERSSYREVKFP